MENTPNRDKRYNKTKHISVNTARTNIEEISDSLFLFWIEQKIEKMPFRATVPLKLCTLSHLISHLFFNTEEGATDNSIFRYVNEMRMKIITWSTSMMKKCRKQVFSSTERFCEKLLRHQKE
jgi:hypothetical protein